METTRQLEEKLKVARGRLERAKSAVINAAKRVVKQPTQTNIKDLAAALITLEIEEDL